MYGEFQFDPFLFKFLAAHLNKTDHFKEKGVFDRVILKRSLKEMFGICRLIHEPDNGNKWRALANKVMNLRTYKVCGIS